MAGDAVFDIFREEAREHLGAVEKLFLDLEAARTAEARRGLIDSLFRHAHSLKGDARVVGLDALKQTAQVLEDVLDELRHSREQLDRAAISQGLAQYDKVRAAFQAWQAGEEDGQEPRVPGPTVAAAAGENPASAPEEAFTVRVPSDRLDRMLNLAGEIRISQRSRESLQQRLADLSEQITTVPAADLGLPKKTAEQLQSLLRNWQVALLDSLQQIEGDLQKNSIREELLVDALETDIREVRLLPLVMLTDTLRRAVRDLAQSLGKDIRYEADVGKIMLDKAVIESLKEPLLHLVRNAADHGVETPEQRRAAGKAEAAVISVRAARQGELVRISVSDDGRGVDYERVRARLRQAGELDEARVHDLCESGLNQYLFRPGFTTAPSGDVSGRGVGLDAARYAVQRLHGTIDIETSSPAGTTLAITVPVTVSSVRILSVLAGGQYFGIPTSAIVCTGRVKGDDLRQLQNANVLSVDGAPVRCVRLADLVGGTPARQAANGDGWPYLLVVQQGKSLAVAVDDLEEETEVLIKPLGFPLGGLPGIVGAATRADGAVQLVLDLASPIFGKVESPPARSAAEPKARRRILVVDDSPTTRAVLRNVLTAAGYVVRTATDGVDALERLRSGLVDLVVTDVEMPRLNGFDLTRQIKASFALPVILVTAKEKEEHRREGLEAGADAYVVKSTFQGEGLLDIVRQLL